MTRRPLVAGNWKMNLTVEEGLRLLQEVRPRLEAYTSRVDVVVLPPAVTLWPAEAILRGSPVQLGAQNACWEDHGPFTGEISPRMLVGWCPFLLIGHSERRQWFHETDREVSLKLRAAFRNRLTPIVAVGETLDEHDAGQTEAIVRSQLMAALEGSVPAWADSLSVAYEPIWAIGTGRAATPEYANGVMAEIRRQLRERFSAAADGMRILYGGSVTADNAADLMAQPEIDGALVGGASLKADAFTAIVAAAAAAPPSPA
jgi:triosephosphate isomerase